MMEVLSNDSRPEEVRVVPIKTVEDIGSEELIKHPLQNTWTLWYYENDRKKTWEENQREIISFDTIEDFWSLFNHIKGASELKQGCDYSLFKKGISPMWEDQQNRHGGRWLACLDKKLRGDGLDKYWLDVVLLLIGEGFDASSEEIRGAVINIRAKTDKIGVWTGDVHRENAIQDIGRKLKDVLQDLRLDYQSHKDTSAKSGSVAKNMYTL